MGTVVKDEAVILKVLGKKPKGIRSTDLWFAVRGSVRSLTTFQKRLKHLEQMGRIETRPDLDDMRATIIKPTETSAEASGVLEGIDLLERLYLGKPSRKVVTVAEERPGPPSEEKTQETVAMNLLRIAHEAFLKSWKGGQYENSHLFIQVYEEKQGPSSGVHFKIVPPEALEAVKDFVNRVPTVLVDILRRWLEVDSMPSGVADEMRRMLAALEHGETIPS
jgi:hypothetical protein